MEGNRAIAWRRSSYSGNDGANRFEVGNTTLAVAVRDSKNPHGPALAFGPRDWQRFTDRIKAAAR